MKKKYNYYCNLDKEEYICEDYIDNGWCKQMERSCPWQKENIFGLEDR